MRNSAHPSRSALTLFFVATALVFPVLAQATTVDGSSWGSFYDSIEVMQNELPAGSRSTLIEDVHTVDQYYFGLYADGVYTQLGDLRFKESLSGLSASQIHQLAVRLKKERP